MTKEQKILLLFVLVIIGGGVTLYVTQQGSTQPQNTVATSVPATNTQDTPASQGSTKKLVQDLTYPVPENHEEKIHVAVTLDATGSIVDVVFTYDTPTNRDSKEYLGKFAKAFNQSMVVGKKLSDVKLSRIGGASLTTNAFNDAVANLGATTNG